MSPALVISRREIRTYFNSPVAYIVVTRRSRSSPATCSSPSCSWRSRRSMRGFFGIMPLLFMFLAPAITMRLLADEKSSGTLELLITMPVRDWEVVVGKFLAAMALLCTALGADAGLRDHRARARARSIAGPTIGGYLGLLLMGGAYVAIGVMARRSRATRSSRSSSRSRSRSRCYLIGQLTQFVPAVAAAAGRVPQHRQPLREHQPRRHRHAATSSTTCR